MKLLFTSILDSLRRLGIVALFGVGVCGLIIACSRNPDKSNTNSQSHAKDNPESLCPVNFRKPNPPKGVSTGAVDDKGQPIYIACNNCHVSKPSNAEAKLGTPLKSFHQGLEGKHGNLSCVSCHNPSDGYTTLKLADGKSLPYSEVMQLCAQCHSAQNRDYLRGAHGGMTGHWDRTKGEQTRNNCIDCHNPHSPKYPLMTPVSGPNDRKPSGGKS